MFLTWQKHVHNLSTQHKSLHGQTLHAIFQPSTVLSLAKALAQSLEPTMPSSVKTDAHNLSTFLSSLEPSQCPPRSKLMHIIFQPSSVLWNLHNALLGQNGCAWSFNPLLVETRVYSFTGLTLPALPGASMPHSRSGEGVVAAGLRRQTTRERKLLTGPTGPGQARVWQGWVGGCGMWGGGPRTGTTSCPCTWASLGVPLGQSSPPGSSSVPMSRPARQSSHPALAPAERETRQMVSCHHVCAHSPASGDSAFLVYTYIITGTSNCTHWLVLNCRAVLPG